MSKLAEQINYAIQNKRAVDNNFDFNYKIHNPSLPKYLIQVAFEATFGTKYYVDEGLVQDHPEALTNILRQVKLNVVEEIFGEFRKPIKEIRHHLYNKDIPAALETLSNLENKMFNI